MFPPGPVERLLTINRLDTASERGKQPGELQGSPLPSSEEYVGCCVYTSFHKEFRKPSISPQRRGFRERIRTFIACQSSRNKGRGENRRQLSDIRPTPSPESPVSDYYSADHKIIQTISEMSPDSPPVELYSPPTDSTCDFDGRDYFTAEKPHRRGAQRIRANPQYTSPGTPIAELPGNDWQCAALNAADGQMTHTEWSLDNTEIPSEPYNEGYYPQADVDHSINVSVQHAVPELLSPQDTSYKSSPSFPKTPVVTGSMSPGQHYFAPGTSQSREPNLFQCIDDSVALGSTADVFDSSLEGSTLVQARSGFDIGFDSSNQEYSWGATQKNDVMDQADWSEALPGLFQPHLDRVEDRLGDNLVPDTGSLDSSTTLAWEFEMDVPEAQPVLQRATTLSSRLPDAKKLSLQEQRAREGTWQLNDSNNWVVCDPLVPIQRIGEARNGVQDHAPMTSGSRGQLPSEHGYFNTLQPGESPVLGKSYRPVKCSYCENRYTGRFARGNMRRHAIHKHGHGRCKVYKCRFCNNRYRRSDARRTHEHRMHSRH